MSTEFKLVFTDLCPKCHKDDGLYGGPYKPCRGCERLFEAGDLVMYKHQLGRIQKFTEMWATHWLFDDDEIGADYLRNLTAIELVKLETFMCENWNFSPLDKNLPCSTVLVHQDDLTHASHYYPSSVGVDHPYYVQAQTRAQQYKQKVYDIKRLRVRAALLEQELEDTADLWQQSMVKLLEARRAESKGLPTWPLDGEIPACS